jgi:hypothetical protein
MKKSKFQSVTLLVLSFLGLNSAVYSIQDGSTLSVYFENDLFANTDREYTNGTKFSLVSPDIDWNREILSGEGTELSLISRTFVQHLAPISRAKDRLLQNFGIGWDENVSGVSYNVEFVIGQQMYTPENIESPSFLPQQRPYAGWLYGGIGLHRKTNRGLNLIELNFGFVGPASFARQTQNFIHGMRKIKKAQGWDYQLKNELGIGIVMENKDRLLSLNQDSSKLGLDLITHYGFSLGNILTQINLGMEFRFGWNIPKDFGESLLGRSGNTSAPNSEGELRWDQGFSWYLFTGVDGRFVARNIFLDGNTFVDSPKVDKEPLVGDLVAGTSARIGKRLKLTYSQVVRTREYKKQNDGQMFGAAYISWIF